MRWGIVLSLAAAIALLCAYSGFHPPETTLDECIARPHIHDGEQVRSPHEAVVGDVGEGFFTIRWDGKDILVRGRDPRLKSGEYLQLKGIFHRDGYIEAKSIAVGKYRREKMLVSVIGGMVVAWLLWRKFGWDSKSGGFAQR